MSRKMIFFQIILLLMKTSFQIHPMLLVYYLQAWYSRRQTLGPIQTNG